MQQLYANELRTTGKNFIPIGIKLDLKFDLTFEHLEKKTEIIKKFESGAVHRDKIELIRFEIRFRFDSSMLVIRFIIKLFIYHIRSCYVLN